MNITLPLIDDAIGGTVIYEAWKGDFTKAKKIAEEELKAAKKKGNSSSLADALLASGVVHLMQGECPAAISCFREIEQAVPSDADRHLRALTYTHLATMWQYNLFPGGGGAGASELELRWNGVKYMEAEILRRKAVSEEAGQTFRFEGWLVHDFLASLQPQRAFLQTNRYSSRGKFTEELLKIALQAPAGFRQTAEMHNAPASLLAYTDMAAADLCWCAGNVNLGEEFSVHAFESFKQNEDPAGVAACKMMWGDWLAAPFSNPQVWNFAIQESSTGGSELAWTLEEEEFDQKISDLKQAQSAYDEAERFFEYGHAPRGLASIQLRWGYLAMLEGNYQAAIAYAQKAQDGFEQCGDILGFWLAQAHRILDRIGAGERPEEHATAEAMGRWGASEGSFSYVLGLGLFLGRAGRHWLTRQGDYERALSCFRVASTLFRALGAPINLAGSLVDQGLVYHALGERGTAVTLYEQALDVYQADLQNRPASAARICRRSIMLANSLYRLYEDEMNPEGMERNALRAQTMVQTLQGEGALSQTVAHDLPGLVSGALYGKTMQEPFSGIEIFALTGFVRNMAEQARVLVPLYRARKAQSEGNEDTAARLFKEALRLAREANEEERDFLEAVVQAHQKDYSQAADTFRRHFNKSGFVDQLASAMGQTAGDQGQAEVRRQRERKLENAFSFMVQIKAYKEANLYLDQLVEIAGAEWPLKDDHPWQALGNEAEMYEGLGHFEKALATYDRAIVEFEKRRTQLSRDELKTALAGATGIQNIYFHAARTAFKIREAARSASDEERVGVFARKAFDYSEQGRARALLDLMAGSVILTTTTHGESRTLGTWRRLTAQLTTWRGLLAHERAQTQSNADGGRITALTRSIDSMEAELRQVESELSSSDPDFYRAINPHAQIMGLDEVSRALPTGTAILQYYFLGEDQLSWAVTREGMAQAYSAAVDVALLTRKIQNFHRACERKEPLDALSGELSEIFLKPLGEVLRTHSSLIVIPYGAAHVLPFHALPWEGQPLAASHVLSYLPNASTLQYLRLGVQPGLPDSILAVGDPTDMSYKPPMDGEKIPCQRLPAAGIEASYVAGLFPRGRALIGNEATKGRIRELITQYPMLHFATHGYLSEEAPLLSAILLAKGDALTVYELMGLNLKADLVVLSACRTGLGETTGGGDVLGLTRGLLGAGVRAAVVSLWPVNDLSTSLLMGEFYRCLIAGDPPAPALQKAQNYLRGLTHAQIENQTAGLRDLGLVSHAETTTSKDYHHPHYWAPFILVG